MDNDKKRDLWVSGTGEPVPPAADTTGRARNRTVMLSPEMTGQMRGRLGGDSPPGGPLPPGLNRPEDIKPREDASRASFGARSDDSDFYRPVSSTTADEADWRGVEEARFEPKSGFLSEPSADMRPAGLRPALSDGLGSDWQRSAAEDAPVDTNANTNVGKMARGNPIIMRSAVVDAASISGPLEEPQPALRPQFEPEPELESDMPLADEAPVIVRHTREEETRAPEAFLQRAATKQPAASPSVYESEEPEQVFWKQLTPLVGFLVTFDHEPLGAYVELRSGRLIVTSEGEPSGNCLVIRDSSVSPMHAIMRVSAGSAVQILDQLSENGTRIKRAGTDEEELISGEKSILGHGDVVMFGERRYHVCLLT